MKDKCSIPFVALVTAVACLAMPEGVCADTWQQVDDFIYEPGGGGMAFVVSTDRGGGLYVGGWAWGSDNVRHALLNYSADAGDTWQILDDFVHGGSAHTQLAAVHVDEQGFVYSASKAAGHGWILRRSMDGGSTWETVDDFVLSASVSAVVHSLVRDADGNLYAIGNSGDGWVTRWSSDGGSTWQTVSVLSVGGSSFAALCVGKDLFVAGTGNGPKGPGYWQVRKSADGGFTWSLVDNFRYEAKYSAVARAIAADDLGNLYVVGAAQGRRGSHWTVRKGQLDGPGWITLDAYRTGYDVLPMGVAASPNGDIYVTGQARDRYSTTHWLTRRLSASTGQWVISDDFLYTPKKNALPYGIATDSFGAVFVCGQAAPAQGSPHWIVRKADNPFAAVE